MTRHTLQRGYVSEPIRTRNGVAFKIRYRVRTPGGKWKQRSETLYGLPGKKAAREALGQRINQGVVQPRASTELTLREFVETFWKPYLIRKNVKPATKSGYESVLKCHLYPHLGDLPIAEIAPLHVESLVRRKEAEGLSPKSIRNLLIVLQGIFHIAVDNDLVQRSPVRKSHKPECPRFEKSTWTPDQIKLILESAPAEFSCLFSCVALTGLRVGELLASSGSTSTSKTGA